MKLLPILLGIFLLITACGKDYCGEITDITGDGCCRRCFRTQEKLDRWIIENGAKPCAQIECE